VGSIRREGSRAGGGSIRRSGGRSGGKPKDDSGGVTGFLGDVLSDLEEIAVNVPAGLYQQGKATGLDIADLAREDPRRLANPVELVGALLGDDTRTRENLVAGGEAAYQDLRHPLRNPGYTLLTALGLVGGVAGAGLRGATAASAAGRATGVAGKARAAGRALTTTPQPGPRVLRVGDLEARGQYSRAAIPQLVQRATDRALQGAAPGTRAERILHKRASKFLERTQRVEEARARSLDTRLAAIGKTLKPEEWQALRLVAEETPVSEAKAAAAARALRARRKGDKSQAKRHELRVELDEKALAFIEDAGGKPAFKSDAAKLSKVLEMMRRSTATREDLLAALDRFTPEQARRAKTRQAQVALGASLPEDVPPSKALERTEKRVEALERRFQRTEKYATFEKDKRRLTEADVDARLGELEKWYDKAVRAIIPETSPFATSAETAAQTRRARAAGRRKGRAVEGGLPTYIREGGAMQRDAAAKAIDDLIRKNPDNPTLKRVRARVEELDSLRATKEKLNEAAVFGGEAPRLGSTAERGTRFTERAARLGGALSVERDKLATLRKREATRQEKAVGRQQERTVRPEAFDFESTPEGVFVGSPTRKTRRTGRVEQVGSAGVIGQTSKNLPSLKRATGKAREAGLERLDAPVIVAERGLEAQRLGQVFRVRDRLRKAGTAYPVRPDDVFMRLENLPSSKSLPPVVRQFLDDPDAFTPETSASLVDRLREHVFEEGWSVDLAKRAEFEKLAADGKGVFIPRRLLGNLARRNPRILDVLPPGVLTGVDAVNNFQKLALIYLKGAYAAPQVLSNVFANLTQQGVFAPANLTRSFRLNAKLGERWGVVVDDLMDTGYLGVLASEGGPLQRATSATAGFLGKGVDRPFRRASFLHEARRAGYRSDSDVVRLLSDADLADDLADVVTRAKQEIFDFSELSPRERAIVTRIVFVYPWLKAATKYTGRFVRDKPVQTAALAQLARQGQQATEEEFGQLPSWLEGAIAAGGGRVVNPASAGIFSTPAEIGEALANLGSGEDPFATVSRFYTPALGTLARLTTGRDELGREAGGLGRSIREELVANTPIARVAQQALPETPLTRALIGERRPSKTFPDRNEFIRFMLGGLYPERVNRRVLRENARR